MGRFLLGVFVALLIVASGWLAYDKLYRPHVNETDTSNSEIVVKSFRGANALKVASARGEVRVSVHVNRLFGMLQPRRLIKAPFSVDYFVNLSRLNPRDVVINRSTKTVRVYVPDVQAGIVNIDESRAMIASNTGWYVSRGAGEELVAMASGRAEVIAQHKASEAGLVAAARARARLAIAQDFLAPLQSAGVDVDKVEVAFQGELDPVTPITQQMDRSRSIRQVFGLDP